MSMEQALFTLQLHAEDIRLAVQCVPRDTPDIWKARTAAVHRLIKDARKGMLRAVHPDVCRDEGAEEAAKRINWVADELLKLQVGPPPAPPPARIVFVGVDMATSTSTSSFYTTTHWPTAGMEGDD